jgi:hypothetical protein
MAGNARTIAGPPIDRGCGGDVPNELFEYANDVLADAENLEESGGQWGYGLEDMKQKRWGGESWNRCIILVVYRCTRFRRDPEV